MALNGTFANSGLQLDAALKQYRPRSKSLERFGVHGVVPVALELVPC